MRIIDGISVALETARAAPMRAALSIISFMIGIAAPTFIFGVSNGVTMSIIEITQEDFRRKLSIYPSWSTETAFTPTKDDIARIEVTGLNFEHIGGTLVHRNVSVSSYGQIITVDVHGITPDTLASLGQLSIVGQSRLENDSHDSGIPCIVNQFYLEAHESLTIPHEVSLQRVTCWVVGVVQAEPFSGGERPIVYLPLEAARRVFQELDQSSPDVSLRFDPRRSEGEINRLSIIFPTYYEMIASVDHIIHILNAIRPDPLEQVTRNQIMYTSFDIERQERALQDLNLFLFMVMVLISGFVVLTVGLNAYYAIRERSNEISIMLAFGARQHEIVIVVLIESGIYIIIGGLLGALAAAQLSGPFSDPSGFRVAVDAGVLARAAVVLAVSGSLAAAIPAWHASRVDPAAALKY